MVNILLMWNRGQGVFSYVCCDHQDDHAIASYERAAQAQALGITKAEIVPVTLEGRKGQGPTIVSQDEECHKVCSTTMQLTPVLFWRWS